MQRIAILGLALLTTIGVGTAVAGKKKAHSDSAEVFMATETFTVSKADDKPRSTASCPGGKTTVPLGGGMVSNPSPGHDGEGVYPHSYERLGSQRGWHVTPVLYDPSSASTAPRSVTLQVKCGPKSTHVVPMRKTVYVQPGEVKQAVATCPGQRRLFGGGFQRTNFVTRGGNYVTSSRAISAKQWAVTGSAFGNFGGELTAIAYCRRAKSQIVEEVSAETTIQPDEYGSVTTPACPGNKVMIFGGFHTSPEGPALFADGYFDESGGWTAGAYVFKNTATTLTAYGYCHSPSFPPAGKEKNPFKSHKAPEPLKKAEKAAISERVLYGGCYPSPKKLAKGIHKRTKLKTATAHTQGGVNRRGVVYVLEKGASCDLSRLSLRNGDGVYTINSATGVVSLSN